MGENGRGGLDYHCKSSIFKASDNIRFQDRHTDE